MKDIPHQEGTPAPAPEPPGDTAVAPADDADFEAALKALARPEGPGRALPGKLPPALERLAPDAELAAVFSDALAVPGELGPDTTIDGRYRVRSVLGRGGMGVVLEAEQLHTGKVVAIKWMSTRSGASADAAGRERLRREARTIAKVAHAHVVDVLDAGEWRGVPFLVMERLVGESLRTRLERGTLGWDEARAIMRGVLAGVGAAHAVGVVHRDLKPDNIFLCRAGGAGPFHPKVLDFGVAAVRAQSAEQLESLTRTGALVGTPAYMAPEQLLGQPVDERTDVYALGVVLFEMLLGRLPFEPRSAAELAVLQATRSAPRLGELDARLRGVPERVVARALARGPEQRYPSVAAFADELAQGPRPRRRWLVAGLAVSVVVGGVLALAARPSAPPAAAERGAEVASAHVSAPTPPPSPPPPLPAAAPTADARVPPVSAPPAPAAAPTPHALSAPPRRRRPGTAVPATEPVGDPTAPAAPRTRTSIRIDDF